MIKNSPTYSSILLLVLCCYLAACHNAKKPPEKDIAQTPEELRKKVPDILKTALEFAAANNGKIDDSIQLDFSKQVQQVYEKNGYTAIWSQREAWLPIGDSMLQFITQSKFYGLFPDDYHFPVLDQLRNRIQIDTSGRGERRDAVIWANADLMLTDAFMHIIKDVKLGRLPQDSITLRKDTALSDEFYFSRLSQLQQLNSLSAIISALEPVNIGYQQLKQAIPSFLNSIVDRAYTVVPGVKDPNFKPALQQRLIEGGYLAVDTTGLGYDSARIADAVKAYQKQRNITVDGKAGEGTVRELNFTDKDRFVRIAISMDRYKMLPEKMPDRYIWVNLPGFYMELRDGDSTPVVSKIICGKPLTRTPLLTSSISNIVTYPQWTIPNSIIVKEILPAMKRNTGYLAEKGYSLINSKGDEVSPDSVDWSKYSKGIPYNVVQGSGDENALGILKFNFPNKYAVYLHDTNQRYLFARTGRSLSHGCVRVQEWQKLAYNIVRYDYKDRYYDEPSPVEDSMKTWLSRKEKHFIGVQKKLPVYIRYFTCEGKDGQMVFYDDIYGEDRYLQGKYFAGK